MTNEQEIIEGNRLIAKFINYPTMFPRIKIGTGETYEEEVLPNFHYSWDFLMPAVEKIESMDSLRNNTAWSDTYFVNDFNKMVEIGKHGVKEPIAVVWRKSHTEPKINAMWQSVVKFIVWYKEQKQ